MVPGADDVVNVQGIESAYLAPQQGLGSLRLFRH